MLRIKIISYTYAKYLPSQLFPDQFREKLGNLSGQFLSHRHQRFSPGAYVRLPDITKHRKLHLFILLLL